MLIGIVSGQWRHACEQRLQAFRHCRVGEYSIPYDRKWLSSQHGSLNGTHEFPCFRPKSSESENAIAVRIDDRLHEPTFLRESPWPPDRVHWQRCNPTGDGVFPGLRLVQANAGKGRVNEDTVRNQAVTRAAC